MTGADTDFDVAKAIAELLKDMDKARQQRVLRWVAEGLEVVMQFPPSAGQAVLPGVDATPFTNAALSATGRSVDIKTFVESKKPKSDNQFAAVVAYYYRFEASPDARRESITADDLQDAARLASRTRLNSPLKTLNNAKNGGYLDSAERGAFQINSVGENLVAMTLPGQNDSSSQRPQRRLKSKRK